MWGFKVRLRKGQKHFPALESVSFDTFGKSIKTAFFVTKVSFAIFSIPSLFLHVADLNLDLLN